MDTPPRVVPGEGLRRGPDTQKWSEMDQFVTYLIISRDIQISRISTYPRYHPKSDIWGTPFWSIIGAFWVRKWGIYGSRGQEMGPAREVDALGLGLTSRLEHFGTPKMVIFGVWDEVF